MNDYGIIKEERLLQQSVNQKLFDHFLQEFFTVAEQTVTSEVVLGKDEVNAVRYAAWFVPDVLLKKYEQPSGISICSMSWRYGSSQ